MSRNVIDASLDTIPKHAKSSQYYFALILPNRPFILSTDLLIKIYI